MRPLSLKTRIFLDSADPKDTREAITALGFLDGQTTNPSLLAKNKKSAGNPLNVYRESVRKISEMVDGSVSIEINASKDTDANEMFKQACAMDAWLPNKHKRHIKFPITLEGIKAAILALNEKIDVNMTLCFSEEQAAAVYIATRGATKGQVFISPFVGRLDDVGQNGMDLIKNIIEMYKCGDGHVEVLTASVRNLEHLLYAFLYGSDIVTAPLLVIKEWAQIGKPIPGDGRFYPGNGTFRLAPIPFKNCDLSGYWRDFDIRHPLTDAGLQKFYDDWNKLLK